MKPVLGMILKLLIGAAIVSFAILSLRTAIHNYNELKDKREEVKLLRNSMDKTLEKMVFLCDDGLFTDMEAMNVCSQARTYLEHNKGLN
jgi:predicted phosphoribosyltransferase